MPSRFPSSLLNILRETGGVTLALSGGLDSRFLAHAACSLAPEGFGLTLVHCTGPHVSKVESASARAFAAARGLTLHSFFFNPLSDHQTAQNAPDRCRHCKKALFTALAAFVKTLPNASALICDGTNASDLEAYRPGLLSLKELGIRSPLAEAGLAKPRIRELALASGLENPHQKARPCLLTRFAYGLPPTAEALEALETAEAAVASLLRASLPEEDRDFRLRLFPLPGEGRAPLPFSAALHIDRPQSEAVLRAAEVLIKAAGFHFRGIEIMEQISGAHDKSLGLQGGLSSMQPARD